MTAPGFPALFPLSHLIKLPFLTLLPSISQDVQPSALAEGAHENPTCPKEVRSCVSLVTWNKAGKQGQWRRALFYLLAEKQSSAQQSCFLFPVERFLPLFIPPGWLCVLSDLEWRWLHSRELNDFVCKWARSFSPKITRGEQHLLFCQDVILGKQSFNGWCCC